MRRAAPTAVTTAAALGIAALLAVATPAHADPGSEPIGVVVRHDDGSQSRSIRVADLYPTAERQVVLLLEGPAPAEARRMRLGVEDLVDRENGCGDPEVREGDTTCGGGDGAGELSALLEVTLTAGRRDGDGCTAAATPVATTLRRLAGEPAVVGLPAGDDVLCVIAGIRHAEGEGDDVTQSDAVRFDLRMDLDAVPVAAAAAAGGATIRPAGFATGAALDLGDDEAPGIPLGIPLLVGGIVCGVGALLLLAAVRRGAGVAP